MDGSEHVNLASFGQNSIVLGELPTRENLHSHDEYCTTMPNAIYIGAPCLLPFVARFHDDLYIIAILQGRTQRGFEGVRTNPL